MSDIQATRRQFLRGAATATAAAVLPGDSAGGQPMPAKRTASSFGIDVLRRPDRMAAYFGSMGAVPLQYAGRAWTCAGVQVSTEAVQGGQGVELPVSLTSAGGKLTHLHLRWDGRTSGSLRLLGDHWERSYGDLEWRTMVPERVMPWYFLTFDGKTVNGYGVKTQPSAFCFWRRDGEGVSLWIDVRNGGEAALLGDRELRACTVVARLGQAQEPMWLGVREFCRVTRTKRRIWIGGSRASGWT